MRASLAEDARAVFNNVVDEYLSVELHPVERRLLAAIGTEWGRTSMLDLGIGAGRTTYTFAAICGSYVGIDYAPAMVGRARERFPGSGCVRIEEGDATAMPQFGDASFDVVLFSFNGLDNLDHDGRQVALREIRRVLKPGGVFVFSSHTLGELPRPLRLPAVDWRRPFKSLRFAGGAVKAWMRIRRANRDVDHAAARARGWAVLREAYGFALPQFYVTASECVRQVTAAGLHVESVLDRQDNRLEPPYASDDPWLFYWCKRA